MNSPQEHLPFPHEQDIAPPLHDWNMQARRGSGLETHEDVLRGIGRRLEVYEGENSTAPTDAMQFTYDPNDFRTTIEYWDDDERMVSEKLTLEEYLQESHVADPLEQHKIKEAIADAYLDEHEYDLLGGWWHNLDDLEYRYHVLQTEQLAEQPTEQLIVGQADKGIRFYNFSQAMGGSEKADCVAFVDILTQYMNERAYDVVKDVIIVDFDNTENKTPFDGFAADGGIFIDARLLREEKSRLGLGAKTVHSRFKEVLIHEAGHLIHGEGDKADEQLEEFAEKIGWDIAGIKESVGWWGGYADISAFEPSSIHDRDRVKVTMPDGTILYMNPYEHDARFGVHDDANYDINGKWIGEPHDWQWAGRGAPSVYGTKNPMETSAETTASAMLGGFVMHSLPDTRDAWLEHLQQRLLKPDETPEDWPVATRLDRLPIICERRTGDDILYPKTELPESIPVVATLNPDASRA